MTEEKKEYKVRRLGPIHTYPTLKRDAVILVGLIVLLFLLKTFGG